MFRGPTRLEASLSQSSRGDGCCCEEAVDDDDCCGVFARVVAVEVVVDDDWSCSTDGTGSSSSFDFRFEEPLFEVNDIHLSHCDNCGDASVRSVCNCNKFERGGSLSDDDGWDDACCGSCCCEVSGRRGHCCPRLRIQASINS